MNQYFLNLQIFFPLLRPFISFLWTLHYIFIFTPHNYTPCFIYFHCLKLKNLRSERKVSTRRPNKVPGVLEQWELWPIFSIKRNLSCVSDETHLFRSSSKQGSTNFPKILGSSQSSGRQTSEKDTFHIENPQTSDTTAKHSVLMANGAGNLGTPCLQDQITDTCFTVYRHFTSYSMKNYNSTSSKPCILRIFAE